MHGSEPDTALESQYNAGHSLPSSNDLLYVTLAGQLRSREPSARSPWTAGYELIAEHVAYWGPEPTVHGQNELVPTVRWEDRLDRGAVWAERRWERGDRLSVEAGVRAEMGPPVRNAGAVRLAPRASARLKLTPEISLSASAGRTYQYEQTLLPGGVQLESGLQAEYIWALAGDTYPTISSDQASAGGEWWLGSSWLGSANTYVRRATGVIVPNPAPGSLIAPDRPVFSDGESFGRGLELSLRRLAGRWTTSASYTYARMEMDVDGRKFPAPGDRRHELDVTATARLGRGWRAGGAYITASGIPFTRTNTGTLTCEPYTGQDPRGRCRWYETPFAEEPNAKRAPGYRRLDLLLSWGHAFRSWEMSAFAQVHNVLNWENTGAYTGSHPVYWGSAVPDNRRTEMYDTFLSGAPILPVIGFRVAF